MKSCKLVYIIFFLFLSSSGESQIFTGGDGNGFGQQTLLNADLSIDFNDSIYRGGNGNGFIKYSVSNVVFDDVLPDSLYTGGTGNGFTFLNVAGIDLYFFSIDSLYRGGTGRGEIYLESTVDLSLGCGSNQVIWNGNLSDNWNEPGNWDCGTIPSPSSDVMVPSGRPRYPRLYSFWIEIHSLHMRPGSSLIIPIEARLIILGE